MGYDEKRSGIIVREPNMVVIKTMDPNNRKKKKDVAFTVNKVFGQRATQAQVYQAAAAATVKDVFEGYNGTIFAYGQTGAGKSYSMFGGLGKPEAQGIIPRCVHAIFDDVLSTDQDVQFTISCSYIEIYKEQIKDLLAVESKKLTIRQSPQKGIYVENLQIEYVDKEADVYDCISIGNEQRRVASTSMNADSSRSHSVFTIYLHQEDSDGVTRDAKLNLVDLAGSERVSKSNASGETLEEAKKINLSLTCLSSCINALSDGKMSHVPYRTSKLTRLLQESLGGNSKTTLLVACSPHPDNVEETMSTLRFAQRCSFIKNAVHANVHMSVEQLTEMVTKLTSELAEAKSMATSMEGQLRRAGISIEGGMEPKEFVSVGVQAGGDDVQVDKALSRKKGRGSTPELPRLPQPDGDKEKLQPGPPLTGEGSFRKATLCAVRTHLAFKDTSLDRFGATMQEKLISSVASFLEDVAGITEDDVYITRVEETPAALELDIVVLCDSPVAPTVSEALQQLADDESKEQELRKVLVRSLELQHEVFSSSAPVVEAVSAQTARRDTVLKDTREKRRTDKYSNIMKNMLDRRNSGMGNGLIGSAADNQDLALQQLEFEKLAAQLVDNASELQALREQLVNHRHDNRKLENELDLRQLELDSAKERLITANTKLHEHYARVKQQKALAKKGAVGGGKAQPRARRRFGGMSLTSRDENDVDDDDEGSAIVLNPNAGILLEQEGGRKRTVGNPFRFPRRQPRGIGETLPENDIEAPVSLNRSDRSDSLTNSVGGIDRYRGNSFGVNIAGGSPEDTLLEQPDVPSGTTTPAGLLGVVSPPSGSIPSLELSMVSTLMSTGDMGGVLPKIPSFNENEPAVPRRRDHEEVDDLMRKNEELTKTVRRQQTLVERQADMVEQMAKRAQSAEADVSHLTQERDMLNERVGKLELKLYRHGLNGPGRQGSGGSGSAGGGSTARRGSLSSNQIPALARSMSRGGGGLGVTGGDATTRTARTARDKDESAAINMPRIRKPISGKTNDNSRLQGLKTEREEVGGITAKSHRKGKRNLQQPTSSFEAFNVFGSFFGGSGSSSSQNTTKGLGNILYESSEEDEEEEQLEKPQSGGGVFGGFGVFG